LKKIFSLLIAIVLIAPLIACREKRETKQEADGAQVKVLATVNDVPITVQDVQQSLKRTSAHGEGVNPETAKNILNTLVRDELIYQSSLELGLEKNQEYIKKLKEAEAQLKAFKRQEMSALWLNQARSKVAVTDLEAQAYFEKNGAKIRTKYRLWQIFYKNNHPQITKDYQDLKNGMPFEKVALRRFPNLPKDIKAPWEMGYLHWHQIPEPWQGIIDRLETGKISDIITGAGDRYWVIKLVDKVVDPQITFATEKVKIVEVLKKKKTDELYENMLSQARAKAKIVFTP